MTALPWPLRFSCIGPASQAVWNRLSALQVEIAAEAAAEGMARDDIAAVIDADPVDVARCLARRRLQQRKE